MKSLNSIHSSFLPIIINQIYQEPLKSLFENILPKTNFQPKEEEIFRVFQMPLNKIRVVIIGLEPSNIPYNATGLSFINGTREVPKSLNNIYKEIFNSTGVKGNINLWEGQGIFLLNSALTVETGNSRSHLPYWETFTKNIVQYISYNNPCIWFLWGNTPRSFLENIYKPFMVDGYDQKLIKDIPINKQYNYVFRTDSPLKESAFLGCNHFKFTNIILEKLKETKINW